MAKTIHLNMGAKVFFNMRSVTPFRFYLTAFTIFLMVSRFETVISSSLRKEGEFMEILGLMGKVLTNLLPER